MKVLGQVGRTMLVTPNLQYSQLSESYEQDFEAMGVRVICEPISFGEILAELEQDEFNYTIFDCLVEVPERVDIALIQDNLEYYTDLLDGTDKETYRLFINKELTTEKNDTYAMAPAAQLEKTCRQIEDKRLPYPFASSVHNKVMSALLGQVLQIPPQSIVKYLKRGVK